MTSLKQLAKKITGRFMRPQETEAYIYQNRSNLVESLLTAYLKELIGEDEKTPASEHHHSGYTRNGRNGLRAELREKAGLK